MRELPDEILQIRAQESDWDSVPEPAQLLQVCLSTQASTQRVQVPSERNNYDHPELRKLAILVQLQSACATHPPWSCFPKGQPSNTLGWVRDQQSARRWLACAATWQLDMHALPAHAPQAAGRRGRAHQARRGVVQQVAVAAMALCSTGP
jgi:hypothetical protein